MAEVIDGFPHHVTVVTFIRRHLGHDEIGLVEYSPLRIDTDEDLRDLIDVQGLIQFYDSYHPVGDTLQTIDGIGHVLRITIRIVLLVLRYEFEYKL